MSEKVINTITKVLANSYVLLLKKQNYHWNVSGKEFYSIHKLLEEQYNEQFEAIDEIAERIKALGGHTIGSLAEYLDLAIIEEEKDKGLSATEMFERLVIDEDKFIKLLQEAIDICDDEDDDGSEDLMIERVQQHQKNLWMLKKSI